MSIYKRRSGRYAVMIDLSPDAAGRRQRKSIGTFATKKEAEKAERDALQQRDNGVNLAREVLTMNELWDKFIVDAKTRLTPNTSNRYDELWRIHARDVIGVAEARRLRPAHLQDLYAAVQQKKGRSGLLSARTTHHLHRVLFTLLAWAERLDLVTTNVARRVKPPRPNPSPARALTSDEAAAILAATEGERWHPFLVVALSSGMRRGEVAGTTWSAIDLERAVLTVRQAVAEDRSGGYIFKRPKSGRERIVPLSQAAIDALRGVKVRQAREKLAAGERYEDRGLVFADELGRPNLDGATKAFASAAQRLKIPGVTLHSCRHAVATWAISEGADVRTVAALLGHANPNMTLNVYGHVVAGSQERAVGLAASALSAAQARRVAEANRGG